MDPQAYCYGKFFAGRVYYMPHGAPCNHIMAIIDQSNAEMLL